MPDVPYCCKMREKYMVCIVAENAELPTPVDAVDFMDFDLKAADGRTVIRIKYCPFCGKPITGPMRILGEPAGDGS